MDEKYKGRYVYHLTSIDNLDSIIKNGLLATNVKNEKGIKHTDIANGTIQERRANTKVPCGPKCTIHDYVPFYFASRTPMLLGVINKKNCDQPYLVYLCLNIDVVDRDDVVFTDASANTNDVPHFYSDSCNLDKLKWDIINSNAWTFSDDERHYHMAELLVHKKVDISEISSIVVFNDAIKKNVEDIFESNKINAPTIVFDNFNGCHFWFSKFFMDERKNEEWITGPKMLKQQFELIQQKILDYKATNKEAYLYESVKDCVDALDKDFCCLDITAKLKGLIIGYGSLKDQSLIEHSINVVSELRQLQEYKDFPEDVKNTLDLCAYLHDVGKYSAKNNENIIDRQYLDHPSDSMKYTAKILAESISNLDKEQIRKILLLVGYHDLIGDCVGKGRSIKQIIDIISSPEDLNLLFVISKADAKANDVSFYNEICNKEKQIRKEVLN